MNENGKKKVKRKPIRTFLKLGTCSRTYFYLLNQEFGVSMPEEEQAIDPMAGGILQQGYQCGMLWGASLAISAESYRRQGDFDNSANLSVAATRHLLDSFVQRTKSADCEDITRVDWTDKKSKRKHFLTGRFLNCIFLAQKWADEAVKAAHEGLALDVSSAPGKPVSCASETIRKMGGDEKEIALVAGFAGGLGLSGNACGALCAAMWKKNLTQIRNKTGASTYDSTELHDLLNRFYEHTGYEMECHKICGRHFSSMEEHTEYIQNGGCENLIAHLASG